MEKDNPLVSVSWLNENLNNPDLIIFEARLTNPIAKIEDLACTVCIPGALILDIEKDFSDLQNDLPHTMLNEADFTKATQSLGVNKESIIIVYDQVGIYSSPRVWWMFLAMGFKNIYVLDGGFPAWKNAGFDTVSNYVMPNKTGDFVAKYDSKLIVDASVVLKAIDDENKVVIDARSAERFYGKIDEPRVGLRKGHMPNAMNIPFTSTLHENKLLRQEELTEVFQGIAKDKALIFSCGSGVTACIDALAATVAGYKNIGVYDGSWSEWGLECSFPVIKG